MYMLQIQVSVCFLFDIVLRYISHIIFAKQHFEFK